MNLLNLLDDNVEYGNNSLDKLKDFVVSNGYKKILLVTGKESFKLSGGSTFFQNNFNNNIVHIEYSGKALPFNDVKSLYQRLDSEKNIDLIIGFGGGTVLDITKIISVLYSNKLEAENILSNSEPLNNTVDLIPVPTTCGSGSEATRFSVVFDEKQKKSIVFNDLNIKKVILDPNLLKNMPQDYFAASVLDALSQSIESIWSKGANEESRLFAQEALSLLYENLIKNRSLKNLDDFILASHLAGKAINISKTTAAHALSYPQTSYFNIAHGLAVFLSLPHLIKTNYEALQATTDNEEKKLLGEAFQIYFRIFECVNIDELIEKINSLFKLCGFSNRLFDYGINKDELDFIAKEAIGSGRINNNPVDLKPEDVSEIVYAMY